MRVTIEVRQWLPVLAFLVALGWYFAAPTGVVTMAWVTLGGMVLSDFLWARAMARNVTARRKLRFTAMQVGDELEEEIYLANRHALLPVLWAEFVDRSNIPGYTVSSARAANADSHIQWRAHTVCTRRGVYHLGPWELRLGQPFGIFLVRQLYVQRQEILVYPPMAALPDRLLPHRGVLGDHRPLNQPLRAETIASTSVRPYQPGDPLRHIHWRTTARRQEAFVKVFAPEAASHVWLVPDFDASVHHEMAGKANEEAALYSSEEAMVTVTASLAALLLQQNLSVGLFAGGSEATVVLPRQGQLHLWSILQALAPLRSIEKQSLADVLGRAHSLLTGNDLIVVITPSLRPDWAGALRKLARSRSGTGRAEVILIDPASYGSQAEGQGFLPFLIGQGIPANLIGREDIALISGYYGEISRWEFKVLGTGRAVARNTPRAAELLAGQVGSGRKVAEG